MVAVTVDGTVIGTALTDADGNWSIVVPSNLADGAHTVSVQATDAVGNIPALSVPVSGVAIIGPTRVLAAAGDGLMVYDGTTWRLEHRAELLENWAVGGDEEVLVAVQRDGLVLRRDDSRRSWEEQGTPFGAQIDLKAVTGLGKGRYVVVGQDGLLGIMRSNRRPCTTETIAPNNFQAISLAPARRRLYGILDNNAGQVGDPPAVLWLDLPAE